MPKRKIADSKLPRSVTTAVKRAIAAAGGQAEVARQRGIAQPSVHGWLTRGRVPAEHVPWLSSASGVPKWELRPDLYARGE